MPENSIDELKAAVPAIDNLLDYIMGGDYFMGICDECRQAKQFATERERDLWQKYHPHEEDGA